MRYRLIGFGFAIFALLGCNESSQDPVASPESPAFLIGTFQGTYTVIHDYSTSSPRTESGPFDLSIQGDSYRIRAQKPYLPPGGCGEMTRDYANDMVVFDDQCMHTAEFDWTLIIEGPFSFVTDRGVVVLEKYDAEHDRLQRLDLERMAQ